MFQGAAEDPQMALALNFEPALIKKSDAECPTLLFPKNELSIRIGRAGLLSGKLPAARPWAGARWRRSDKGNAGNSVLSLQVTYPTMHRADPASGPGLPFSFVLQTTCLVHRR